MSKDIGKRNGDFRKARVYTRSVTTVLAFAICAMFVACAGNGSEDDAQGTFEATEVVVSSEATGKILSIDVEEGSSVGENQTVGDIDAAQLVLKRKQLLANIGSVESRRPDIGVQIAAIEQQIATANTERKRVEKLLEADAANRKQLDDINAQIETLQKQLAAQRSSLEKSSRGVSGESAAIDWQIAQLDDQIAKCAIVSPIDGTVLEKYAERGELAVPGKALLKVADLKRMRLRAYVTASQLTGVAVGDTVRVFADSGERETREYAGTVLWISDKAEFTPKTIQTRDERANLVYAVKIGVENDGFLRIGMYGSVRFPDSGKEQDDAR
jgi:HlyD family secretion protein